MSIAVKFESPPGNYLSTRTFEPETLLRIGGHVTGGLGLWASFMAVRLSITDGFIPIYEYTNTNFQGDFWFDVILPNITGRAKIVLVAELPLGDEVVEIPISIGPEGEAPMPDPLPDPQEGLTGGWGTALQWLPWIAIGFAIIYALSILPKPKK